MRVKWFALIFFFALFSVRAQVPEGNALTHAVQSVLEKNRFTVYQESLASTAQDDFANNLYVYFSARAATEDDRADALFADETENRRDLMIFAFTQEDAYAYADALLAFLQDCKQQPPACDVLVLFSAQEQSPLGINPALSGTQAFAQNFDEAERASAVVVSFGAAKKAAVYTGSFQKMTPLWLASQLTEALAASDVPYTYANSIASLYRLGFLRNDRRMEAFLRNDMPAIAITCAAPEDLRALQYFADHFSADLTPFWDNHYIFLHVLHRPFWIGEIFFFLMCLILGSLLLLIFCSSTFVGKNGANYKQDFLRSWYFIPLTIAITFVAFWTGQTLCAVVPLFAKASPVVQFGIKLVVALLFSAALFAAQEYFKISSIQFTHGYFIYLIGIANIFIFSAVDILFFVTFFAEYLFIYIARKAVRIVPLIISVVLMLLPFAPYVYQLIRYGNPADLQRLVFATPVYNLVLALLVFPFLIMWLRMIVRLEIYVAASGFSLKRMAMHGAISTGIIVLITVAVIAILSGVSQAVATQQSAEKAIILTENTGTITVSSTKDTFLDMTTQHIHITSAADALRYEISVSSNNTVPLYDSTYDYTIHEETKTASFTIPDYPPRSIQIDYATDSKDNATILIAAWYRTDQPHVFRKETVTYLVRGEK